MEISVEFKTEAKASAEKLWDILTDIESWPLWVDTNFVKTTEPGRVKEGSTFKAVLGGMKWDLKVIKADKPREIAWRGKCPGLSAVHSWEFSEAAGKTTITTRETMTGWLLFFTCPIAKKKLAGADEKWLTDLKARAEST